jgi:hypothetical protein
MGYQKHLFLKLAVAASLFLLTSCATSSPVITVTPSDTPVPTDTPVPPPTNTPVPSPTATASPTEPPTATPDERILNPENQHLYLYVEMRRSWRGALDYCSSKGGYLVTIQSVAENDFVFDLKESYTSIWLGASDATQEGVWEWANGEPWTFTYWEFGEPNNCHEVSGVCTPEHYLSFWSYDNRMWNDLPNGQNPFVCEWDPISE